MSRSSTSDFTQINPQEQAAPGADAVASVDCVTTASIAGIITASGDAMTITSAANETLASRAALFDNFAPFVIGTRILVSNVGSGGAAAVYSGIFEVIALGAAGARWRLIRPIDADASYPGELTSGMTVHVTNGAREAGRSYILRNADPITIGTTALNWAPTGPLAGAGQGITIVKTAPQAIADATNTVVTWDALLWQTPTAGGAFAFAGAGATGITVNEPGIYSVAYEGNWAANAAGRRTTQLRITSETASGFIYGHCMASPNAAVTWRMNGSAIIRISTVPDEIQVIARTDGGGGPVNYHADAGGSRCELAAYKLAAL